MPPGAPGGVFAPDHHDILVHERHRVVRNPHLDDSALPEPGCGCSGNRVERDEPRSRREDDARGLGAVSRPVRHASPRRCPVVEDEAPELPPCGGIERHDPVRGREVT